MFSAKKIIMAAAGGSIQIINQPGYGSYKGFYYLGDDFAQLSVDAVATNGAELSYKWERFQENVDWYTLVTDGGIIANTNILQMPTRTTANYELVIEPIGYYRVLISAFGCDSVYSQSGRINLLGNQPPLDPDPEVPW
jgi:hypothetical protein